MDDMIKVNVNRSDSKNDNSNDIKNDRFITPDPIPRPDAKRPKSKKPIFSVLALLLVLGGAGYGGYWYYSAQSKKEKDAKAQIELLATDKAKLQQELDNSKKTSETTTGTTTSPTATKLASIKDAISSKNTASLEQLMANKVTVLIAASGGIGDRTPAQAVKDLDYVTSSGTSPWDFNLSADTINGYRAKFYGQYFPIGSITGKSANKYVISFLFNDEGKIIAIFMANSEATLLQ